MYLKKNYLIARKKVYFKKIFNNFLIVKCSTLKSKTTARRPLRTLSDNSRLAYIPGDCVTPTERRTVLRGVANDALGRSALQTHPGGWFTCV